MNKTLWKYVLIFGLMTSAWSLMWNLYGTYIPIYLQSGNPAFTSKIQSAGFGLSVFWASLFLSIDEVIGMVLGPLVGIISDRFRRRIPFIIGSVGIAVIGTIALPIVVKFIPVEKSGQLSYLIPCFVPFIIAALFLIVGHAAIGSPDSSLKMELVPSDQRTKIVGYSATIAVVVSLILLSVTPLLYKKNPEFPFFLAAGLSIIAAIVYKFFLHEPENMKPLAVTAEIKEARPGFFKVIRSLLPDEKKSLIAMLLCLFLGGMGINSINTFASSYAVNVLKVGEADTMYLVVVCLVGAFVAYIPAGHLASKLGRFPILRIGMAGISLSGLLIYFFPIPAVVYCAIFLFGIFTGMVNTTLLPILSDIVTSQSMMGFVTGCFIFVGLANSVIGNVACGSIIQATGSYNVLWLVVAFGGMGGLLTSFFSNRGEVLGKSKA